jgi:ferric-dicitrate binding protein FerR (iron transport regulator)
LKNSELALLFEKFLTDNCTITETQQLMDHFHLSEDQEELRELVVAALNQKDESYQANPEIIKVVNKVDIDLFKQIDASNERYNYQPRLVRLWPRIAAAASIILIAGAGLFYYNQKQHTNQVANTVVKQDIRPGGSKAILTLANGKKISLTDAANGAIAKQSGVSITKTANGQLIYSILHTNHNSGELEYNTVETPKGGQYKVQLPDGTSVWLNAESSLKYPASFAALKERKVELNGEAYFEVAKDKTHPFKVKTNKQEVEVLGTHFNINSYANEPGIKTTLLEGSIKVSNALASKIIKPGQQSFLMGDEIHIDDVDTQVAVAWKNNNFMFENNDIKSVMRMVERWYNVEIVYDGPLPTEKFGGAVSRFDNISSVLKILESTGGARFRIEDRKIFVSK